MKQITTDTLSAKLANATLGASSGGAIAAPHFGTSSLEMTLYTLGVIISIIAVSYNECHVSKSETIPKLITKTLRYVAVGAFTYPTAYVYAGEQIWNYSAFKGLAGVIATLSIVMLLDAWLSGKSDKLRGDK